MSTAQHVGVVGLGLVGTALAGRLARAGFSVWGCDHDEGACQRWQAQGGQLAPSLQALAAQCPQVVLAVFDTAGVLQVVEGGEGEEGGEGRAGLLSVPGVRTLVDCSTGEPEALQALALRLAARGVDFIEAPLSGSSQQIAQGSATLLLGATPEALQRNQALLQALAEQQVHVGGAGMGARAKLATNLVLGLNRAALAEGMAFAEQQGIDASIFLTLVLATPARSDAARIKGPAMVHAHYAPQSRIVQHLKDLRLMLAAAQATGQRLPFTEVHARLLQAAVAHGEGELDNAAIIEQMRRERSD